MEQTIEKRARKPFVYGILDSARMGDVLRFNNGQYGIYMGLTDTFEFSGGDGMPPYLHEEYGIECYRISCYGDTTPAVLPGHVSYYWPDGTRIPIGSSRDGWLPLAKDLKRDWRVLEISYNLIEQAEELRKKRTEE